MSTHSLDAQLAIPQTNLDVPVQINVGGGRSSTTSSATPAPRRGWVWGVLGTLLGLGLLALLGLILLGVWRDAPVTVNYSSDFGRLEQQVEATKEAVLRELAETKVAAVQSAQYGEANHRLIVPVAKRVAQTGEAVDRIGGVVYDADGKIKDSETILDAIKAAELAAGAATRAELARSRVVVRRVEVPGAPAQVDLSGLNARFDSLEAAISARPTLERLNP